MTYVHSMIYGARQDLNAFLAAERLIMQVSPFTAAEFLGKFSRYTIHEPAGARSVPANIEILSMEGQFPNSWINTDPMRQDWRRFLANAISQGLQHETVILRGGTDQEYVASSKSMNFLEIINEPKINVRADLDQQIPLLPL
jgi:hypothetical protein